MRVIHQVDCRSSKIPYGLLPTGRRATDVDCAVDAEVQDGAAVAVPDRMMAMLSWAPRVPAKRKLRPGSPECRRSHVVASEK